MRLYNFFSREGDPMLFRCPCCNEEGIDPEHVQMLDDARAAARIPFIITSGYRCVEYNKTMNGGREHPLGHGSDIALKGSGDRLIMMRALFKVGFNRIGDYPRHLHVGTSRDLAQGVMWHGTYPEPEKESS